MEAGRGSPAVSPLQRAAGPPRFLARGASGPVHASLERGGTMSRQSVFGSPLFLGFDHLEQMLDRVQKGADGYPPYNIEQVGEHRLRITLAV
ncbi:MAG TPA: hypothetical protein VE033_08505, partial [Acetobacteraceae bacterium]|nr:hypothetical protein [Acetobacteraceae bacterium]